MIGADKPPPDGVMIIRPEYAVVGVTVNILEAVLTEPAVGPVNV